MICRLSDESNESRGSVGNTGNFKKGSVDLLILHLLRTGDKYGFELTQLIREHSGGTLDFPEGSLYPSLYRLEEKGYVSFEKRLVGKRRERVYYHIEPSGEQHYAGLLAEYYETQQGIQGVLDSATPTAKRQETKRSDDAPK
jgi:PadR family transcriptional regulator PadR